MEKRKKRTRRLSEVFNDRTEYEAEKRYRRRKYAELAVNAVAFFVLGILFSFVLKLL